MNIYEHFACYDELPIKLADVRQHILDTGLVRSIIRIPVTLDHYIMQGGYHLYRDIRPYVEPGTKIARIGYPKNAPASMQRLVIVKEMLHILDPHEATAPTRDRVDQLIKDLRIQNAGKNIGLPATVDKIGLLHALCILMPRDILTTLRPQYKAGKVDANRVAEAAGIPLSFVEVALTDEWIDMVDAMI